MKLPQSYSGINTTGLTGIVLMTLHITGYLVHWAWPILYIVLILSGIGQEYKKYYDELIKAKIIFFDVKKASKFIKKNFNNLDDWWFSDLTQKKIKYFCSHVCRYEDNLKSGLEKIYSEIRQNY